MWAMMNMAMNKKVFDNSGTATAARGLLLAFLGILIVSLLSACATSGSRPGEEKVEDRAQERWDALFAGDIETAYGYFSPGYRSSVSLIDYGVELRMRRVQWTSATYQEHSCQNKTCDVKFKVGYKIVRALPGVPTFESQSAVDERWIQTDGQWWYLPQKQ